MTIPPRTNEASNARDQGLRLRQLKPTTITAAVRRASTSGFPIRVIATAAPAAHAHQARGWIAPGARKCSRAARPRGPAEAVMGLFVGVAQLVPAPSEHCDDRPDDRYPGNDADPHAGGGPALGVFGGGVPGITGAFTCIVSAVLGVCLPGRVPGFGGFAGVGVLTGLGITGVAIAGLLAEEGGGSEDRKSTRLNSSHVAISYAVFCL